MKIDRRENVNFIVTNYKIDLYHKLQLPIRMCFFSELSSVISKFFVADFEHVFFCWKRPSTKTIVLILKYLAQQTNTYSKSAAETLKANSRDCTSLLTACSMSKTLFKCFWCTMNMPLFTTMFCCYDFFFDVFIVDTE